MPSRRWPGSNQTIPQERFTYQPPPEAEIKEVTAEEFLGEHGTGKRKRADFLKCYGPEAVEEVRCSKAAVDPDFLLNRNNVIEYKNES
ncbi:MAG: hypothetical protein KAV18_06330 [Candidatus Omnitrophica bacterium]|nr:hypothetical protein [Candidatus Omnitrophota bacterium]